MSTIRHLLAKKGNEVWSLGSEAEVYVGLALMAKENIGALLVMDGDEIAGIFSERDYARKVILKGKSSKSTPLAEIMTKDVITVGPEHTIESCLGLMTENKIRHLPVMEEGKVVGVISIGDLVNTIIKDQKFVIGQLENYIQQAEGQQ
jgi:CBS domain-containing protein